MPHVLVLTENREFESGSRKVVQQYLGDVAVDVAASCDTAAAIYKQSAPDIVVVDLALPQARDILKEIREWFGPSKKILFIVCAGANATVPLDWVIGDLREKSRKGNA